MKDTIAPTYGRCSQDSTVADAHRILPHAMSEAIRGKSPDQLSPYEGCCGVSVMPSASPPASMRWRGPGRNGPSNWLRAMPTHGPCFRSSLPTSTRWDSTRNPIRWSVHFRPRRAVELGSSGHRAYQALALALSYRKEIQAFRTAAERTLAKTLRKSI